MVQAFLHSDWVFVAAFVFLFVFFATPTVIAVIRGVEIADVSIVILFSMFLVGWPGALIMAFATPGRVREGPPVRLPRVPGYPPDPRYPPGDPRAGYPLP